MSMPSRSNSNLKKAHLERQAKKVAGDLCPAGTIAIFYIEKKATIHVWSYFNIRDGFAEALATKLKEKRKNATFQK
jgi:hypothetical protein